MTVRRTVREVRDVDGTTYLEVLGYGPATDPDEQPAAVVRDDGRGTLEVACREVPGCGWSSAGHHGLVDAEDALDEHLWDEHRREEHPE